MLINEDKVINFVDVEVRWCYELEIFLYFPDLGLMIMYICDREDEFIYLQKKIWP